MTLPARLAALTARVEADPAALAAARVDGDALADALDGDDGDGDGGDGQGTAGGAGTSAASDAALRWRIAVLRAVIAEPPDGDAVRELYGELVDRYRDQPARLAVLRALGDEIRRLEAQGTLARSLVVRSDRRPHRR